MPCRDATGSTPPSQRAGRPASTRARAGGVSPFFSAHESSPCVQSISPDAWPSAEHAVPVASGEAEPEASGTRRTPDRVGRRRSESGQKSPARRLDRRPAPPVPRPAPRPAPGCHAVANALAAACFLWLLSSATPRRAIGAARTRANGHRLTSQWAVGRRSQAGAADGHWLPAVHPPCSLSVRRQRRPDCMQGCSDQSRRRARRREMTGAGHPDCRALRGALQSRALRSPPSRPPLRRPPHLHPLLALLHPPLRPSFVSAVPRCARIGRCWLGLSSHIAIAILLSCYLASSPGSFACRQPLDLRAGPPYVRR